MSTGRYEDLLRAYDEIAHDLRIFSNGVVDYIGQHPTLVMPGDEVIHSYKSRLKDREHLRAKIARKEGEGRVITVDNIFDEITDLAGARFMHLFQGQFTQIDSVIRRRVELGDWHLSERPKAYTWDPEAAAFFRKHDLDTNEKASAYTSVHYLIRPRANSPLCCEVQVRTLFEEIWGEVDHRINYPKKTENLASREQIAVLSKIVGAGSRLLDSLTRVHAAADTEAAPDEPKSNSPMETAAVVAVAEALEVPQACELEMPEEPVPYLIGEKESGIASAPSGSEPLGEDLPTPLVQDLDGDGEKVEGVVGEAG
ncbi:(p)ppGpp synthetase [Stenotrophomonas indicatrix]|uniref:(p)ppGpp synthetase n=1 Tax=Stenotrophomonas indicatrix TaxID=2045451 RepID=UPI000FDBCF5C|nr:(p)ppGpp synthetase [Stenotrophomonas indicatrix]